MDAPEPCLSCQLPDCDEADPGCRRQVTPFRSKWRDQIEQVAGLQPGQCITLDPVPTDRYRSLQSALQQAARGKGLPFRIRTRSHHLDGSELTELQVWRANPLIGRHWSRWAEDINRLFALEPGQECAYTMATPTELGRLQNALYRRATRTGVLIETWRTHGDDHLVLHARKV
jgi:hypothetical protein